MKNIKKNDNQIKIRLTALLEYILKKLSSNITNIIKYCTEDKSQSKLNDKNIRDYVDNTEKKSPSASLIPANFSQLTMTDDDDKTSSHTLSPSINFSRILINEQVNENDKSDYSTTYKDEDSCSCTNSHLSNNLTPPPSPNSNASYNSFLSFTLIDEYKGDESDCVYSSDSTNSSTFTKTNL